MRTSHVRFRLIGCHASARSQSGLQLVEFATALILLIVAIVAPLLSISLSLVRVSMTQYATDRVTARLARSENFSKAYALARSSQPGGGNALGLSNVKLSMVISSGEQTSMAVSQAGAVPPDLLPGAGAVEHNYSLLLQGDLPVDSPIPGQAPAIVHIRSNATWENLGRNPVTRQFYLNE